MPRRYSATIAISSVAAAETVMYVTAHTNRSVRILGAHIGPASNTTNQLLDAALQRIGTLGSPTATTVTPAPYDVTDTAFGGTCKGHVTASEPTYSSNTQLGRKGFSSLAGYEYHPYPDEAPVIKGGESIGLRLLTTSPTSIDLVVTMDIEEIG